MGKTFGKNLADSFTDIYNTKWSFINTFGVAITAPVPTGKTTIPKEIETHWKWLNNENLQKNIISINSNQFTNSEIEAFVGDRWKIHNGRDELYRFDMTIRDQDDMSYYKFFVLAYKLQKNYYFDEIKLGLTIYKDPDWYKQNSTELLVYNDLMISNISQLQFSNQTENQIAEFTVSFKAVDVNIK